jgi:hypothetical protein
VLVPEVTQGGVADQAGFKSGDVILRVGDMEVKANPGQVRHQAGWRPVAMLGNAQWLQGFETCAILVNLVMKGIRNMVLN